MSNHMIKFGEPIEMALPIENYPDESLYLSGHSNNANNTIFFVQGVFEQILQHVYQNKKIECGGVLVGYPFNTSDGRTFIVITGALEQNSDNRSAVHFTVSPEENTQTRTALAAQYPGLIAVGWYHSHPGLGVFLSGQDMTIVRSIYNTAWNVALVVDPVRKDYGLFIGPEGAKLECNRFDDQHPYAGITLRAIPDFVKAMALINQLDQKRQETQLLSRKLRQLARSSNQPGQWKENYLTEYTTTTNRESDLKGSFLPDQRKDLADTTPVVTKQSIPVIAPHRAQSSRQTKNVFLLVGIEAFLFVLINALPLFLPLGELLTPVRIVIKMIVAGIIAVTGGYLVVARSSNRELIYSDGERIAGVFLLLLASASLIISAVILLLAYVTGRSYWL